MQDIKCVVSHEIEKTFRNEKVMSMFDIANHLIVNEYNIKTTIDEKKWNIGLIVGPSGSGKTTIANNCFPDYEIMSNNKWDNKKSIIDSFDDKYELSQITDCLSKMGFNSPPSWLKPYKILSNGQKFRADLAKTLIENETSFIIDEYTSIIDRETAKIASNSLQKYMKKKNQKVILLSCHYDIIEWLNPCWIIDLKDQKFNWRLDRQRPEIKVDIRKGHWSEWEIFKEHHYMNKSINKSCANNIFIAEINGNIAGFASYLKFPHPQVKNLYKEHRRVVLPEYQCLGIGNALSNYGANHLKRKGFRIRSTTKNKQAAWSLLKDKKNWKLVEVNYPRGGNRKQTIPINTAQYSRKDIKNITFEYIG